MNNELVSIIFGKLQFDSERKNWNGKVDMGLENLIDITIGVEDYDTATVINLAEQTFTLIRDNEKTFRDNSADELLELHNETWNEGEVIDKDTFSKRIKLDGILFFCEGEAELYYNDDDLFWGHTIAVGVSSKGVFEDAQIYG